jgi:pyruvate/2-oxoacid:ferredoxin oxidoreductase alpha subunit
MKALGVPVGWFYTMYLNPLPPKMLEELKKKDLVIVPELNYQGQFASILRSQGVKAEAITQYTGLPFKVRDLVKQITEVTEAVRKEAAGV